MLPKSTVKRRGALMINRREFVRNAALAAGAVSVLKYATLASPSTSTIEVLLDEPLGTISPNIYGHFVEHLGTVVYDGVWVGEDSKIANVGGIRKQLIEALRAIQSPVIRWPGGCFADTYDWKDGIGPQSARPRRTNFWSEAMSREAPAGPQRYDPNQFGTNEFIRLCKLTGSQPYLAANVRSLPAEDFYRWVEYCNSPAGSTTLADARKAAGFPEPFGVRYWGVGNESWGCGGNFTAEEYAMEFKRFATWVPRYGMDLSLVAAGPEDEGKIDWVRVFLRKLQEKGMLNSVYGISLHYYTWNLARGVTNDWEKAKGDALKFETVDWYELFRQADRMESQINSYWQTMGQVDSAHKVKLIVDEWGPWYRPGTELSPVNLLGQASTLRDALASALTLDIFNRHCDKVAMANCAQLINCLNSLFLAQGDQFVTTPVYEVFRMYAAHQGGQGLRTVFAAPALHYPRDGKDAAFWGLNGSASLQGKEMTLTLVNPHAGEAHEAAIVLHGASVKSGSVTTLTHTDMHAQNTFANPREVQAATAELKATGGMVNYTFPARSVTMMKVTLA
jgi:alpha-N-arabinofuranosidase